MPEEQNTTNGGAPMPAPDTTKHRLRLDYKGCDGDPWSIDAYGASIQFAIIHLREHLEKDTSELEESDAAEFYEIIAEAIATPGEPSQRRDFSTPESDFDVTYYPPEFTQPTLSFYAREKDGSGYFYHRGALWGGPMGRDGTFHASESMPVDDYEYPLTAEEREEIAGKLKGGAL